MRKKSIVTIGSLAITFLMAINLLLFLGSGGVILKTGLFSTGIIAKYSAWDIIFGTSNIDYSVFGMIGFFTLIIGGLIVLIFPFGSFRFLLSFILLMISLFITYSLPHFADLPWINIGHISIGKPSLGTHLIISVLLQGVMIVLNAALFTIEFLNRRER